MRLVSWLMAVMLLAPLVALAQDAFTEGKELFETGEYARAIDKLQQVFREEPGNLDATFYLGRSAFETGDYEAAVAAFERILIVEPDAQRVKLELARAHLKLGSRDIAREYFKSVQATNPPPAVWQQIQQFIDTIDAAEKKHLFNGFVTLGGFYDDNVGMVSSVDTLQLDYPSIKVRLDNKVEKDAGTQATAVVNHIYRFIDTPYVWKSTLTTYNNFYNDETAYNINYLGFNTGVVRQDDDSLWELQGTTGYVELGSERYVGLIGGTLNHTRFLVRHLQLSLGAAYHHKNFFQEPDRDAHNWVLSVNPVLTIDANRLSVNLASETETAKQDRFNYQRTIAGARYDRQLPMDFAVYIGGRYQGTEYEEKEIFFNKTRTDKLTALDVGLSKVLWRSPDKKEMLAAQVSYSHSDNDSNVEVYSYKKDVTLASVTFAF